MIRVGVIGYGYWGPNVVRNFQGHGHTRVEMLCDMNPSALARAKKNYPALEVTTDPDEILKSPKIDAVAMSPRYGRTTSSPKPHLKMASTCSWKSRSLPVPRRPRN